MDACLDSDCNKVLRRPLIPTTNINTDTTRNYFPRAVRQPSGFYAHFDTQERSFKPSSRHIDGSYGYEKIWRPTRARVEGAGISSLGSNMTSRQPEQWKPCIRYIDPGARTWLSEQSWKPGKKLINPKENAVESEPRTIRKKFLQAVEHPDGSERASYRGPGIFIPRPAWDPPFRKADIGDLQPIRHPRRHLNTYRDEFESRGVKDVLNPNVTVLPAMGKRRLPTYRNEQLSLGVGGAIRLPDFHFRDVP
ncbi:hypothetical protein KP509_13G051900 [Ceratopteris richardii]|uniref:Uncharacterized protein n=1 Tax=Ceratopteris richardii TaxID=49495 RepID=A0A8T2TDJ3_CERRI|nr:hypothetical protein KP509_13G051900 [Ceratopteris richardii]KAH7421342.1 hypothetical protein KP509_13G051900 [Ceratopteris richardii]